MAIMRILHVFDHGAPKHSGYVARSEEIVCVQREHGWQVASVTSARQGPASNDALNDMMYGAPCFRTPTHAGSGSNRPMALMRDAAALRATVRAAAATHAPDLIHVHSPALNFFPSRIAGVPIVYEIRAFWEDAAVADGRIREGSLRYALTRRLETAACQRAAHVFTICEGLRNDLLQRGIAANRISLAPNAVQSLPAVDSMPEPLQHVREVLQGKTVLGFFGSFYDYEGLDRLFEAVQLLPENVALLVIGQGPMADVLYPAALALGGERVQMLRPLPRAVLRAAYALCDLMVFPRRACRLTDTVTPLKIPEAMCMGIPVAASNVGGHRELIRENETGFLLDARKTVTLAADLNKVLQQRARWPQVAAAASAYVAGCRTRTHLLQAYINGYAAALGGASKL